MKKVFILACATALFLACTKEPNTPAPPAPPVTPPKPTGWAKITENFESYPIQIPASVIGQALAPTAPPPPFKDLSNFLPPPGDQGSYGTCVAWSTAYGVRSYLNAVDKMLSPQDLAKPANQISPHDLWLAIPPANKGAGCDGTNFSSAFNVLVSRGAATMATAPYSKIACSATPPASWTAEAGEYKIKNYRLLSDDQLTVDYLKSQLAQGHVISIGARLGDNFVTWKGNGVLSSDTYLLPGTKNAYHAVVLVGYDDAKGNGAFLLYNSWGSAWGDKGFIWIDYNFFLKNFLISAIIAKSSTSVVPNIYNEIEPQYLSSETNILAYSATDSPYSGSQSEYNRQVWFSVFNAGQTTLAAASRWSVVYMYYNAYNANDYGILTHYYYTDEVKGSVPFSDVGLKLPVGGVGLCINNSIPPGKNLASVYYNYTRNGFVQPYHMPALNGKYYLVLIADVFNKIPEDSMHDNFYFIHDSKGQPIDFVNGTPTNMPTQSASMSQSSKNIQSSRSPVSPDNPNAYSPEEIQSMIIALKNSGKLESMLKRQHLGAMPLPSGY